MRTHDGQPKVLDFGIARMEGGGGLPPRASLDVASLDASPITRTGGILGTPHYMSPERREASRSRQHRISSRWASSSTRAHRESGPKSARARTRVVCNRYSNTVSVLLGDGLGGFSAPVNTNVGTRPVALVAGDIDPVASLRSFTQQRADVVVAGSESEPRNGNRLPEASVYKPPLHLEGADP